MQASLRLLDNITKSFESFEKIRDDALAEYNAIYSVSRHEILFYDNESKVRFLLSWS